MGLCDRLEAARASREGVRDRLTAASFARLNAPDTEIISSMTPASPSTRCPPSPGAPTRSSALRQTVLNLAVRGKLVPPDAKDETVLGTAEADLRSNSRRLVGYGDDEVFDKTPFPIGAR